MLILTINPGSTSTKIALFNGEQEVFHQTIRHSTEELSQFEKIASQRDFREGLILQSLEENQVNCGEIAAIVGRGGLLKPITSGIYEVNASLLEDLQRGVLGEHASNLGGILAQSLAKRFGNARAFIADPVVVDELEPVARITGLPDLKRISIFHALNQKAIARTYAKKRNAAYESLNLIVAHLGGGISIGAHRQGRVIDVNNTLDGEGPFSPERAGTLPTGQLVSLCFSGKYNEREIKKMLSGKGGLVAHTGSNNAIELEKRAANGDESARLLQHAMGYAVGKFIGEMAAVLHGKVDAILITGGMAYNRVLTEDIREMVEFIAPVEVYPGEDELAALAMNGRMALSGELEIKEYN